MEFAKSLCEKPDTRMLRDYGRQVVSVVDALCAMFCQVRFNSILIRFNRHICDQEDGGGIVRLGALECLGSITKGHDWSREVRIRH